MLMNFLKERRFANICQDVVKNAEEAIIMIDEEANIMHFNLGAEATFGFKKEEVMGKPINILIPERFHKHHSLFINEFSMSGIHRKRAEDRTRQILGRHKSGQEILLAATILKTMDGSSPCFTAIMKDITKTRQIEEELSRLAATDPLTGAYNRREMAVLAEKESLRAKRYERPLSILMIDIDHFKILNDTHGHAAGDKALQRFTAICTNTLRNMDIFGRWGGEEFVALLPETDINGAEFIAERLRTSAFQVAFKYREQEIYFTISIGVALFHDDDIGIDAPLARADKALYKAKADGRDRVVVGEDL